MSRATIHHGDLRAGFLSRFDPDSFDGVLCDPPYGLRADGRALTWDDAPGDAGGFRGKKWDSAVPGVTFWREVFRVLKPGASVLAFGGTRTYHRLACAIEDAGFETQDSILCPGAAWIHGQGFPKSRAMSKAVASSGPVEEAAGWGGYGTALKPAWEPVVWAMKPLEGTFAENAMRHGVAGINIDGARIAIANGERETLDNRSGAFNATQTIFGIGNRPLGERFTSHGLGRWPANLILCHSPDCVEVGTKRVAAGMHVGRNTAGREKMPRAYSGGLPEIGEDRDYADADGTETVPDWRCAPGCPVAEIDRQSGQTTEVNREKKATASIGYGGSAAQFTTRAYAGNGGASRFFYCAKVSAAERNGSGHPTLKPIDLCRYLARLILPPSREDEPRRILVPFSGMGSEIIGALQAGWEDAVGVEGELEYVEASAQRIRDQAPLLWEAETVLSSPTETPLPPDPGGP